MALKLDMCYEKNNRERPRGPLRSSLRSRSKKGVEAVRRGITL